MAEVDSFWSVLAGIPWWAWIPIVAIIGGTVQQIVAKSHKHQERMEMIRHGIDPRDPTKR